MNKKLILPIAVLAIAGAALFGTSAYAQSSQNGYGNMTQKLAQKLGIEESKVQAAFDEIKVEHHKNMEQKLNERLDQAVEDGKLTQEQKALILAKHAELQQQRESEREQVQNMTPEERKAFMENRREEMAQWAEENGIEFQFYMGPMEGQGRVMHVKWAK